jgi:thioredoxin
MGVIGGVVGFGVVSLVAGNKVEWTPAVAQVETREALDTVLASAGDEPVLVDFYATWCPPCRATAPNLNQVAAEGHRVAVVDVDRASDLAQEYSIEGVPTLLVFRNKRQVDRQVGYHSVAELTQLVVAQRR